MFTVIPLQALIYTCRSTLGACMIFTVLMAGNAHAAAPFVDNGDGTVTDTSTGLMWDQCSLGQTQGTNACSGTAQTYTWEAAHTQVGTVLKSGNYKGYGDWRLPSVVELRTLVKSGSAPTIDTTVFPATQSDYYWTSTNYALVPSYAWIVNFYDGYTFAYGKANSNYVRLVRSGQSFGSFASLPLSASATGLTTATLTSTSAVAATGYWMVLPRAASSPTADQIKVPATYTATTVVASGNAAMTAKTAKTFAISGLTQGTAYDVYLVGLDSSYGLTSAVVSAQFNTPAISTRSIVVDATAPTKAYSALDGAGVYRSTDSGANWTAATTQPSNLNVRALAIKSASPTTLFAASYGGGVFKSTDSAANWAACAAQPTNLNLLSLAIDASGRLYAGSEAGVFVSTDDCATWTVMNTGLPN
jgi:hypothetical protein